ncbi:MAG: YabP/YqfC family sporulation protein [Bacillota bacterium]|nr:YabP/YqfC family sporulation protein [Bacillota bacterium]
MSIKEELAFDFAVNLPRIMVAGKTAVLDNVKQVMLLTDSQIVIYNGNRYTSVSGHDFVITQLKDERMMVRGEFEEIKFFEAPQKD